jgi:hypothetical protein
MRRSLLLPPVGFAALLVFACTDQPELSSPDGSPSPSFRAEHTTEEFGFPLGDERYTLIVGHTLEDMVAICEGREPSFQAWDVLRVFRPAGREGLEESIKDLTRGKDMAITVFEYSPFEFGNECPLLTAPTYEGTGQAFFNDNDLILTHRGANSFNFRVNGKVVGEDGQRYHVKAFIHQVLAPGSTFDNFIFLHGPVIDITLTPVGR